MVSFDICGLALEESPQGRTLIQKLVFNTGKDRLVSWLACTYLLLAPKSHGSDVSPRWELEIDRPFALYDGNSGTLCSELIDMLPLYTFSPFPLSIHS